MNFLVLNIHSEVLLGAYTSIVFSILWMINALFSQKGQEMRWQLCLLLLFTLILKAKLFTNILFLPHR